MRPTLPNARRPSRPYPAVARAAILSASVLSASIPSLPVPSAAGPSHAAATPDLLPVMTVLVDNAKVIRLPERTQTVIVGNPFIAEVTPQRNGVLVLTGKSFGATNLIALDAGGAMVAETMIRVEAARDTTVTVQRGLDRESLSCTPHCQPSAQLGDASKYYDPASGQAEARRKLATSTAEAGSTGGGPPPMR